MRPWLYFDGLHNTSFGSSQHILVGQVRVSVFVIERERERKRRRGRKRREKERGEREN